MQLICVCWNIVSFWGVIRNIFLAWMSFSVHNERIATKLAKKMGKEQLAGQLFCNAHTALVWLFLIFLLSYLV